MPRALPRFAKQAIVLVKKDGQRVEGQAIVTQGNATVFDGKFPVEVGDEIERTLPSGIVERYEVTDSGYSPALGGIPEHYAIKLRNPASRSAQPSVVHNYNVSGPVAAVGANATAIGNTLVQHTRQAVIADRLGSAQGVGAGEAPSAAAEAPYDSPHDPTPSSTNGVASSVSSASMFEPAKTRMTSKQKGTEGKSVTPTRWRLSAQPVGAPSANKSQIHQALMGSILKSDGGTGSETHWPAVLRPSIAEEEVRSDGARVWHRGTAHGADNVRDEEQLGHANGTVWFQRAYFWDASEIQVDFGQCGFDALVFLKLMTRVGNALGVNRYDVTLGFEAPASNVVVTIQTNRLKSRQPSRTARTRGTYLEATARLMPKTSLPDQVIACAAKSLLDGVANEFELGDDTFVGPTTGPSFLEIDEDSLLGASLALS